MAACNHFTGKTKPFKTPRRKFGKINNNRNHRNKYEKNSLKNKPKYTNGYSECDKSSKN